MSTVIHSLENPVDNTMQTKTLVLSLVGALLIGTAAGYVFSLTKKSSTAKGTTTTSSDRSGNKVVGVADKKTFKDQAEGTLKEGGIEGEGTFHLERPGGESQNVYLTSTTVDLSEYVGKKVRVWGATFTAEKAGWLMDVGLVEVLQ
jgi:hypothetical protein